MSEPKQILIDALKKIRDGRCEDLHCFVAEKALREYKEAKDKVIRWKRHERK